MAETVTCRYCGKEFENKSELELHKKQEHNDKVCFFCGKEFEGMPFKCKYCGKRFCSEHRLPENHNCTYEKGEEEPKWFERKKVSRETETEEGFKKLETGLKKIGWVRIAILIIVLLVVFELVRRFLI